MGCTSSKGLGLNTPPPAKPAPFRETLVLERKKNPWDYYKLESELGEGAMGLVYIVKKKKYINRNQENLKNDEKKEENDEISVNIKNKEKHQLPTIQSDDNLNRLYALKTINVNRCTKDLLSILRNEIEIMRQLRHPNIVHLHDVFEWERKLYLVMDYLSGGHLGESEYDELEICNISIQIARALVYLHKEKGICHRDLKLENIMFENKTMDANIKLIDFGVSQEYMKGEKLKMITGTLYTIAPEMLFEQKYDTKADMWSFGVIIYYLVTDEFPFLKDENDLNDPKKVNLLKKAKIDLTKLKHVSKECRHFIANLLRKKPLSRWDATEAFNHAKNIWYPALENNNDNNENLIEEDNKENKKKKTQRKKSNNNAKKVIKKKISENIAKSIENYSKKSQLKKHILMVMAFSLHQDQLKEIQDLFLEMDTENNGLLSFNEIKEGLKGYIPDESIQQIFDAVDVDKTGQVNFLEFIAATLEGSELIEEERLLEAFFRMDTDNSGWISHDNLREILGTSYNKELVDEMISSVSNGDDKVYFEDFLEVFEIEMKKKNEEISKIGLEKLENKIINNENIPYNERDSNHSMRKFSWVLKNEILNEHINDSIETIHEESEEKEGDGNNENNEKKNENKIKNNKNNDENNIVLDNNKIDDTKIDDQNVIDSDDIEIIEKK